MKDKPIYRLDDVWEVRRRNPALKELAVILFSIITVSLGLGSLDNYFASKNRQASQPTSRPATQPTTMPYYGSEHIRHPVVDLRDKVEYKDNTRRSPYLPKH